MAKARYPVEAHLVEGRSVSELAAAHGVHRSWIYKLFARYREGGYEALEPRSRAPRSSPNATPEEVVREVVSTIAHHLARKGTDRVPSVSTIWRILRREGLVVPQPQKRPRCSLIRFEAELPNEMWQADITHWRLADEGHAEILNMIDDHSRLFLASRAFPTTKAADVVDVFHFAIDLHGAPASLLCDNGAVFTATPRGGKVLLQLEMERLGVIAKNSRPYHPQTCGKVERLHQTLKRYLERQVPGEDAGRAAGTARCFLPLLQHDQAPPGLRRAHAPAGLQRPAEGSTCRCGGSRHPLPHPPRQGRLRGEGQPAPRLKAAPHRARPRAQGKAIKLLVADRDIRVLDARTGELIRRLTLDPSRDYQPIGGG